MISYTFKISYLENICYLHSAFYCQQHRAMVVTALSWNGFSTHHTWTVPQTEVVRLSRGYDEQEHADSDGNNRVRHITTKSKLKQELHHTDTAKHWSINHRSQDHIHPTFVKGIIFRKFLGGIGIGTRNNRFLWWQNFKKHRISATPPVLGMQISTGITKSSATAKSTARPSFLVGVLHDIYRETNNRSTANQPLVRNWP